MTPRESAGFIIQLYTPSFAPYNPTARPLGEFRAERYRHTITVGKGFDEAEMGAVCAGNDAQWLLSYGCGAHAVVRDEASTLIWEGRVNNVALQSGGYRVSRGPLTEMANRVYVNYQLSDPTTNEAQEAKRTAAGNNTDSQARYGIQIRELNGGDIPTAQANQIRGAFLTYNAWPRMPKSLAMEGQDSSVALSCLGYAHWLNFPYRLVNVTSTVTVTAKLTALLAAEPNGFFGGANQLATNALTVAQAEEKWRNAAEIISDVVSLGDASFQRYMFGVWADRVVRYEAAPTRVEYLQQINGIRQDVTDLAGNTVRPWAVLPGRWVQFPAVLPGALLTQDIPASTEAPNQMFIERVEYTSPGGLTLQGGLVSSFRQQLAQWGITGL